MNRLPIINDPKYGKCLLIDNSTIELLITCPRAYEYAKIFSRIRKEEKPSLNFGSACHLCLEHRYRTYGGNPPDIYCQEEYGRLLTKHFDENPNPIDDFRTLNWASEVMDQYNQHYAQEDFTVLTYEDNVPCVEMSFMLPLVKLSDITIIYTGRIDLAVSWDGIFTIDHKTTSMLGNSFYNRMKMSAQQKGYAWAFRECSGTEPKGYAVNALRVKEPAVKMDRNKWWSESFQRMRFYLQPGELDEWKSNTIALCEELLWLSNRDYYPMKTAWCSNFAGCQFLDVCTLATQDRAMMLSSGLYTDNTWSPLQKPKAINETINTRPTET